MTEEDYLLRTFKICISRFMLRWMTEANAWSCHATRTEKLRNPVNTLVWNPEKLHFSSDGGVEGRAILGRSENSAALEIGLNCLKKGSDR
jgi:hypothetical protein